MIINDKAEVLALLKRFYPKGININTIIGISDGDDGSYSLCSDLIDLRLDGGTLLRGEEAYGEDTSYGKCDEDGKTEAYNDARGEDGVLNVIDLINIILRDSLT